MTRDWTDAAKAALGDVACKHDFRPWGNAMGAVWYRCALCGAERDRGPVLTALEKKPAAEPAVFREFRDAGGNLTEDDVRRIVREELERYGFRPPGGG